MWEIRKLRADEIEVRPQTIKQNGFSALLYKSARADMNVLDECFAPENWQRKHTVINNNLFCSVLIWDEDKKTWIEKQDVGVPSNAEAEKGEASDAFKRACTNVGIGRELYTSPFIWINAKNGEVTSNGKSCRLNYSVKLHVSAIDYDKNRIRFLQIADQNDVVRYTYGAQAKDNVNDVHQQKCGEIVNFARAKNIPPEEITTLIKNEFKKGSTKELSGEQLDRLLGLLRQMYREA